MKNDQGLIHKGQIKDFVFERKQRRENKNFDKLKCRSTSHNFLTKNRTTRVFAP